MSQTFKRVRTILIGPKISGILDLLSYTQEPIRYERLRSKSRIRFKKSFIDYLRYCTDKKLILNWKELTKRKAGCRESWFLITEEGRLFQELLR